jgi:DNA-binding NtrC family response regulator
MNGPELAERILAIRPSMKVLFMSGYTDRALAYKAAQESGTAFLQKPFTPQSLGVKVREMLAGPRAVHTERAA